MAVKEKVLIVKEEWCKGCGICASFCPKNVLDMKDGKVYVKEENACIKCGLCELRCPDYAIYLRGSTDD